MHFATQARKFADKFYNTVLKLPDDEEHSIICGLVHVIPMFKDALIPYLGVLFEKMDAAISEADQIVLELLIATIESVPFACITYLNEFDIMTSMITFMDDSDLQLQVYGFLYTACHHLYDAIVKDRSQVIVNHIITNCSFFSLATMNNAVLTASLIIYYDAPSFSRAQVDELISIVTTNTPHRESALQFFCCLTCHYPAMTEAEMEHHLTLEMAQGQDHVIGNATEDALYIIHGICAFIRHGAAKLFIAQNLPQLCASLLSMGMNAPSKLQLLVAQTLEYLRGRHLNWKQVVQAPHLSVAFAYMHLLPMFSATSIPQQYVDIVIESDDMYEQANKRRRLR